MFCFKNSAAVWKPNYAVLWDYPDSTVSEGRLIAPKLQVLGGGGGGREWNDKAPKKPQINWYVTNELEGGGAVMFWLTFGEELLSFQGTKPELPAELAAPCSASSSGHVANSGCCKLNQEQSALVSAGTSAVSAACVASRTAIVCVLCFSLGRLSKVFQAEMLLWS